MPFTASSFVIPVMFPLTFTVPDGLPVTDVTLPLTSTVPEGFPVILVTLPLTSIGVLEVAPSVFTSPTVALIFICFPLALSSSAFWLI